jgi:hypothetical protein
MGTVASEKWDVESEDRVRSRGGKLDRFVDQIFLILRFSL